MARAAAVQTHPRYASAPVPAIAGAPRATPRATETSGAPDLALQRIGVLLPVKRGRVVAAQGEPAHYVYRVVKGALRAVKLLADGRRHVADFILAGDFIGLTDVQHYGHSIEAVADSVLERYPRSAFEAVLQSDPRVGRRFLTFMCGELSAAQERLLLLGRKSAMERLVDFLLTMADQAPAPEGVKDGCVLSMTRADIADYLGLTVETVSRLLAQLRSRGIIDVPRPQDIVFLDRPALEILAESPASDFD